MDNNPICPFCQHEERDAWDINFGSGCEGDAELSCGSCGKDYFCSKSITSYYQSSKIKGSEEGPNEQ
jgi:hypothetical protein